MNDNLPKVLALETATEGCSAALAIGDHIIERFEIAPRGHSERILPMIDELLAEAGLGVGQLDAIAFGRGPGAFTGVRIAVGVTQGIAFGADLPVVPVSTLAALAQGAEADRVLAAIDARMGEVYWGAFQRNAEGIMLSCGEESVLAPEQVSAPDDAVGWLGVGSGWQVYGDKLAARVVVTGWVSDALPHAAAVARQGLAAFAAGQVVAAEAALPVYLRDQVAWKKQ
ncbi:MAG: tRNA (adenosine(37)-N6)-threonylcarbamoyltransferase complex dimerization subunit type 1 TsaB [Gammaproteobacteria bacterium]|nr:tRNA (adenosine(37)-N6)-threonylcarbamoyltransferase complex dimerization subunit type 1 TsaB [Gammaproteobacteria bacterium]